MYHNLKVYSLINFLIIQYNKLKYGIFAKVSNIHQIQKGPTTKKKLNITGLGTWYIISYWLTKFKHPLTAPMQKIGGNIYS